MLHQNNGGMQSVWTQRRRGDTHEAAGLIEEADESL
jgi:hypothetical protein